MKIKIILGIVSCLCLLFAGFAYADETVEVDDSKAKEMLDKYRVVDTSLYDDETYITRNDGFSIIMRAIGTPENVHVGTYGRSEPLLDDEPFLNDEGKFTLDYRNSKFVPGVGYYWGYYVAFAIFRDTDLIYGDSRTEDGGITFTFGRPITANETLAFMVRCLDNRNVDMDVYNLEDTFGRAEDLSLIKKTDAFYSEPDEVISVDEFFVLVQRFLYQKRYLYFNRERGYDFSRDEKGSMTYLDYLDATFELGKENDFGALA